MKLGPALSKLLTTDITQNSLSSSYNPAGSKKLKQKRYRQLMRGINIYSYSTFGNLHACERKLSTNKLELSGRNKTPDLAFSSLQDNIDFAYGRAVESGVQGTLLGNDYQSIWFDMFTSWDVPLWTYHPDWDKGNKKSFTDAVIAIDRFQYVYRHILEGWEIAYFGDRPAIELSFCIDLGLFEGIRFYYVGHTDIVLYNPILNRYKVIEIKTTGRKWVHEAQYKNSDQAVGYSIVLDSIAKDQEATNTFEVMYLVDMVAVEEWKPMEFTKSRSARADWINTILLDIQRININRHHSIWPKRGGSCFDFGKPCPYFNLCDLSPASFNGTGEFDIISEEEIDTFDFDFKFTMQDIINTQRELV